MASEKTTSEHKDWGKKKKNRKTSSGVATTQGSADPDCKQG